MAHRALAIGMSLLLATACAGTLTTSPPITAGTSPAPATALRPAPTSTGASTFPPPGIDVDFPSAGGQVAAGDVLFTGTTDPGCSVTVGGIPATVADDGTWQAQVTLVPGAAAADVIATDSLGRRAERQVSLVVERAPALIGSVLDTGWIDVGYTREYLAAGGPTGYRAEPEVPITWSGDDVAIQLGFAEPVEALRREPRTVVGLLLDSVGTTGDDRQFVLDAVAVPIDPMTGILASVWPPEGPGPFLVELRFTDDGPQVGRAWLVAAERDRFIEVPGGLVPYPDLAARRITEDGTGAIVGRAGHWYTGDNPPYDVADLSGSEPAAMRMYDLGGYMVSTGDGFDAALSLFAIDGEGGPRYVAWLEEMVARDYTGAPIWHVTAVLDMPALEDGRVPTISCHTTSNRPAAAIVATGESGLVAERAWELRVAVPAFVEVDASTVECPIEGD